MEIPKGWIVSRLGSAFSSRRESGIEGLKTLSVTLRDGLLERASLGRKTDTKLLENEHLLIRSGDIAYNMMRMWQGALGLASHDAIVSPAYIVLQPKPNIDSLYAAYLFKTPRMIYLFWAYSYGLTSDRLRLYFKDFSRIPVSLPPLVEQKRIAEILSTWDRAIEVVEGLIENSQAQKKALMQQLLTSKKRMPGFDEAWENTTFGNIGDTYGGLTGKSKPDFGKGLPYVPYKNVFGNSAVDLSALELVQISKDENQNEIRHGDILFTTSSETPDEVGMSSVVESPIQKTYLNSFCFGFRPHNLEQLLPEFSRYYFRSAIIRKKIFPLAQGSTRYNISKRELMKIRIQLPPFQEQKAISVVLNSAEKSELEHTEQLAHLKSEKSALMQQLLTGKRRVTIDKEVAHA